MFLKILLALCVSTSAFAEMLDVHPINFPDGTRYVRVTKVEQDRVSFEDCIKGDEARTCRLLGNRQSYTLEELRSQRSKEYRNGVLSSAGVAALVLLSAGSGVIATGAAGFAADMSVGMTAAKQIMIGLKTFGVGLGITTWIVTKSKRIDPIQSFKRGNDVGEDVITDQDVTVKSIEDYISRLEMVLDYID
jgi:hypothetical protein